MVDLDQLAKSIVESDDEFRTTTTASLTILTENEKGRLIETTYTIDFYREGDYQYRTSVRPLSGHYENKAVPGELSWN